MYSSDRPQHKRANQPAANLTAFTQPRHFLSLVPPHASTILTRSLFKIGLDMYSALRSLGGQSAHVGLTWTLDGTRRKRCQCPTGENSIRHSLTCSIRHPVDNYRLRPDKEDTSSVRYSRKAGPVTQNCNEKSNEVAEVEIRSIERTKTRHVKLATVTRHIATKRSVGMRQ
ncbi:uncharacterized protein LOC111267793 [Varroa jacobsoni]|uniref:uncharacterized protein LOC111267793 n=1 Tax=Varroa jacobsoni TaxID=62625 RepID=UPI000BF3317F|nr:uncharacterized protein LOC111267793 [Varroa jacobsoni]